MFDSRPLELPSEARQQDDRFLHRNLKRVAVIIFVVSTLLAGQEWVMGPPGRSQAGIAVAMGVVALLSYFLITQNRIRLMSSVLVGAVLMAGAWSMYSYGTIRASGSFIMVVAVVLAGVYLERWAVVVTTMACVLILGFVGWKEMHGMLAKPAFAMDVRYLLASSLFVGVTGAMLFHMRWLTEIAYSQRLHQMEDRLRVEHERDQSLRRFSRIFSLVPTAILIQSAGSQEVLEANPAFERSLGYRCSKIAGKPAGFLWADEVQRRCHADTLREQGSTGWQSARWLHADGRAVDIWVHSELSEDRNGTLVITSVVERFPECAQDAPGLDIVV